MSEPSADKLSEVESEMQTLASVIDGLSENVKLIKERLASVLIPETTMKEAEECKTPVRVSLADRIRTLKNKVINERDQIAAIISRIEL